MTDLINQITINGETTTFLNYVNPVVPVVNCGVPGVDTLLETHLGPKGPLWNSQTIVSTQYRFIKFPVPWETITGDVGASMLSSGSRLSTNTRCTITYTSVANGGLNSTSTTNATSIEVKNNLMAYDRVFGVINNHCLVLARTSSDTRANITDFIYVGWAKEGQYTGTQFPRNLIGTVTSTSTGPVLARVLQENLTTTQGLLSSNPTLSCLIPTASADSSDVIIRDSTAPNNYIGKLWNMMILPSTAVVGKIYKNTGIDPDTGVVETDQKAFWMCVGSWGTDNIGMRVWTENII